MSEYINNKDANLNDLIDYAKGMLAGERGSDLYEQYKDAIKEVSPDNVIVIVDELVKTGEDISEIKRVVNKILNIFYEPIKSFGKADVGEGSFLYYLMAENAEMEQRMKDLKTDIKAVFSQKDKIGELQKQKEVLRLKFTEFLEYNKHNLKKENILFPYFEKFHSKHLCVHVMWSMQDDARESLQKLISNLEEDRPSINEFNQEIGKLYFAILPVIFREEYILFPVCQKLIEENIWDEMLKQSKEIGFAFSDDQMTKN